jgi:LPXTG-motif cell wall-anchored protein
MKTSRCFRNVAFLAVAVVVVLFGTNRGFAWSDSTIAVNQIGGASASVEVNGVTVDAAGNTYMTGALTGTADFDPEAGVSNLASAGGRDIYVAKYDIMGRLAWAKSVGSTGNQLGVSIATDASGNVIVSGRFTGTVDFDPGAGTTSLTDPSDSGFVLKLDGNGAFVWAANMTAGSNGSQASGVGVDASGNIFSTGYFEGTADLDPGAGTSNAISAGNYDIFVTKLSSTGTFQWGRTVGNAGGDYGNVLNMSSSGMPHIVGTFTGTLDFDPGSGTASKTSNGGDDVYVLKLNTLGEYVWAATVGGSGNDYAPAIAVNDTSVHLGGFFLGTADFDPSAGGSSTLTSAGSQDAFVLKLDSTGAYGWAKAFSGTSNELVRSLVLDSSGNVTATGNFGGSTDFDPSASTNSLTSAGGNDAFVARLDSSGNYGWARHFGSTGEDRAHNAALDTAGNVHLVGVFANTVDFDPDTAVVNRSALGTLDAFLLRLSPTGFATSATTTTTTSSTVAPTTTSTTVAPTTSATSATTAAPTTSPVTAVESARDESTDPLPTTGSNTNGGIVAALVILLLGVGFLLLRRFQKHQN